MTLFLNPTHPTNFSPINTHVSSPAEDLANQVHANEVSLPQLIEKGRELITPFLGDLTQGVNIGQLVAQTSVVVEDARTRKAHLAINTLEAHEKKLQTVTQFLTEIETQLSSNRDAKEVTMPHNLVEDMRQIFNHKLFEKTVWNREEAEALKTSFTRQTQLITQDIHHCSSDVNRLLEESTELLQILRKCIEMWHQLNQTFTSNQRGR